MTSFRPAERGNAKPLIGIYAESGDGKTLSALYLARGFVGPEGKIGMIETEAGRGEAYAKKIKGSYGVLPLTNNFSPQAYGDAIDKAEKAKLDALIIDSASHEWEGLGGVLSMASDLMAKGKKYPLTWQQPKMDHQKFFMGRLLQTPIPLVIVCMRAKHPMKETRNSKGEKVWERLDQLVPKQSEDILYEMFVHFWIDKGHRIHVTRLSDDSLADVFHEGEMIDYATGERLAAWTREHGAEDRPHANGAKPELSLNSSAEAAADRGLMAFKVFWESLSKFQRGHLGTETRDNLKVRAQNADNARQDANSGSGEDSGHEGQEGADVPFGGPPDGESSGEPNWPPAQE